MFALCLTALIGIGGAAVDMGRLVAAKREVQNAVDAAALAAGASGLTNRLLLRREASSYFAANAPSYQLRDFQVTPMLTGETYVKAVVDVPLAFLAAFGRETAQVAAEARVARGQRKLEVALVLDNTYSMKLNGGWLVMREAAQALVDELEAARVDADDVKVSLTTYTTTVNIKGDQFDWDWIDRTGASRFHGDVFEKPDGPAVNLFDLFATIPNAEWGGCVEQRPDGLDLADFPPDPEEPDSLWVPFFNPDENDAWPDRVNDRSGANDYLSDDGAGEGDRLADDAASAAACGDPSRPMTSGECQLASVEDVDKYDGEAYDDRPFSVFKRGPNASCDPSPIIPLTNDLDRIRTAIAELVEPSGWGTNTGIGVIWGFRTLSPPEPYTGGAAYDDPNVIKAIVLMTDGENTPGKSGTETLSAYSAGGYAYQGRLGVDTPLGMGIVWDRDTVEICRNARAHGVQVFTLLYRDRNARSRSVMNACASSRAHAFAADSARDFEDAFRLIGRQLANATLRITR